MPSTLLPMVFLLAAWNRHFVQSVYIHEVITSTTKESTTFSACPKFCVCDFSRYEASCSFYYKGFSLHSIPRTYRVKRLDLFGGLESFPPEVQLMNGLEELDLSRNAFTVIDDLNVGNPALLQTLDLSSNDIVNISPGAFSKFVNLKMLSLSENNLQVFPKDVFKGLINLKTLRLSFNNIHSVPVGVFGALHSLTELDLRSNYIHWIAEGTFDNLTNLKTLQLSENSLRSLPEGIVSDMTKLDVALYGNPWDCSCELDNFLEFLTVHRTNISNVDQLFCFSPSNLIGTKLLNLSQSDLKCEDPVIEEVSGSLKVAVGSTVTIHCKGSSENHAIGYWVTPQGVKISHRFYKEMLEQMNITTYSHLKYKHNKDDFSEVTISENNSLKLTNFRGVFNGTYNCVMINSHGNDTASLTLTSVTKLFATKWVGMIFGGLSALAALVLGLLVGTIKLCAIHVCKCPCILVERYDKPKMETKYTFEEYTDDQNSVCRSSDYQDSSSDSFQNEESLLKVPLNSPIARTPRSSPRKCATPTPEDDLEKGRGNTNNTLIEVKVRLEKKMEKVRSRVHSIRESGSQYLITIKDTGSIAANRVKAGVAMGVEQVKFGVMSMKEFCGTGEMAQTVSVISVNTDVDSEEKSMKITKMTTL